MKKLRALRCDRNLTQYQLSERAGVSQAYINELENGKKLNPSVVILGKLAKALGVTKAELLEEDEPLWVQGCERQAV